MEPMTEQETIEYLEGLEIEVETEEGASTKSWASVDKSKLPKSAFLIVGDPKLKSTWKLPFKDEEGNISLGALRAISAAIAGARTGKPMSIPADVRARIENLLKKYKIGKYAKAKASEPMVVIPDELMVGV